MKKEIISIWIYLTIFWVADTMNIGYACTPITTNLRTNRRVLLKDFSHTKLDSIIKNNLNDLKGILENNLKNEIFLFRISSDIIPLGSHEINNFNWRKEFNSLLKELGKYIKNNNMRVSMHPGQYTVLNSPNEKTLKKSLRDIEYHCSFLDSLNMDYKNKIIIHIGGVYGDKILAKENFIKGFSKLSESSKKRILIENDEKNFSLDDVLDISSKIHVPVVFDNLHNKCYGDNNYSLSEIYSLISKTWNNNLDGKIKVHYSQQDINRKKGSHSPSISSEEFIKYYKSIKAFDPDIMLEVKDKDISSIKCINIIKELKGTLSKKEILKEIDNYKLLLFQYDKNNSLNLNKFKGSILDFYSYLDELLLRDFDLLGFEYSLELAFNIIKNSMTKREISHFTKLISSKEFKKAKLYLNKISKKIETPPKELSYYFSRN